MSDILCFIVDELNLTNKDLLDSVQNLSGLKQHQTQHRFLESAPALLFKLLDSELLTVKVVKPHNKKFPINISRWLGCEASFKILTNV